MLSVTIHVSFKKERAMMIGKDNSKYTKYMYNVNLFSKYNMIRDFAANTPWVSKGKGERVIYWQKMIFRLEYDVTKKVELHNCCEYAIKWDCVNAT